MTAIDRALEALEPAGIPFAYRRSTGAEPDASGEVDIAMTEADVRRADPLLRSAGLRGFAAPGHQGHRFFLAFEEGRWLKLDVKTGEGKPSGVARRVPAGRRRLGPVVAILGPDGSGKGTIIDELVRTIPVGITTVYLGRRRAATRAPSTGDVAPSTRRRPVRETAFVVAKAAGAWARLLRGYAAAWRGHIVLCDRHPIEVLAIRPDRSSFAGALERFMARRLTPRPDAMVILEAPAEVLLARKPEHPAATLRAWQRGYADELVPLGARVVSTAETLPEAVAEVSRIVWEALAERRAW